MEDLANNKEKLILQKFISAEDERNAKRQIKDEILRQRQEKYIKMQEKTKKIEELQEKLLDQYHRNKQREMLKSVRDKSMKLQESILLHRKVIKQLIEQESKFIRKPRRAASKVDKLPYLKKFKKRFIESVNISDSGDDEEVRVSLPQFVIPTDLKGLKIKSITPAPQKSKGCTQLKYQKT